MPRHEFATADMPKIKHLEIYYGDDNCGGDCSVVEVKPLLDDIAKAIGGAKILKGNAFGDLLPNLERDGLDVYGWQIRRLLGTVTV